MGYGDIELKKCTVRKNIFCSVPNNAPEDEQNLLYRHSKPNEPAKEGPLSLVPFGSPFTSVSTVSRGHPSLISLGVYWRFLYGTFMRHGGFFMDVAVVRF
jgi:hypothetical protein